MLVFLKFPARIAVPGEDRESAAAGPVNKWRAEKKRCSLKPLGSDSFLENVQTTSARIYIVETRFSTYLGPSFWC